MNRDYCRKKSLSAEINDFIFLTSAKIIYDASSNFFRVTLPDGVELDVTVDRFLDIF